MKLHELSPNEGARHARKRVGRGVGSGHGKTACRGSKGQNARSGGGARPGYEGGQMPIHRRLPKRGFKNPFKRRVAVVNVRDLARLEGESVVDAMVLARAGMLKGVHDAVKLLGAGEIQRAVTVKLDMVSGSARAKIEAAGGKVEEI
jgi:large subunit ribosomal protein L15